MAQVVLTSASASPWVVPANISLLTKVELFGCGGNGTAGTTTTAGGSGGSGCYGYVNNVSVTPGGSINFSVPAAGSQAATWFSASGTYSADYGRTPTTATNAGLPGATINCIGLAGGTTAGTIGNIGTSTAG